MAENLDRDTEKRREEKKADPVRKDLYGILYYLYGEANYGSYQGLRFRVARNPLEHVFYVPEAKRGPATLQVICWKGPMNFASTPEEEKTVRDFEFSPEGIDQAAAWIYEEQARIFGEA
jgi:hypothetical protein